MDLSEPETRVLGCLVEKQLATPQYYPLTLNSLVAACNQSSNRYPVVDYDESTVAAALAALREHGLARVVHSPGQRADKYRHTLDDAWGLDEQLRAVLALLLLRGPQTVGELRTRSDRLADFASLAEVEEAVDLLTRREQPLVRRLERQPGQKEARWVELLSGEAAVAAAIATTAAGDGRGGRFRADAGGEWPDDEQRPHPSALAELRAEVAELRAELGELRVVVDELRTLLD